MARRPRRTLTGHFRIPGGAYTDIRELIRLRYAVRELGSISLPRSTNPLSGLLASRFRGRGIDFAEVRVYQPGDDVRTIDWRVTARTRIPHTKMFQEEKERPVLILADQSHSMFFGSAVMFKSVLAAQAAALVAWTTLDQGDRVGGIVFSEDRHREIRPRRSKKSVLRLLNEINDFNHELARDSFSEEEGYLAEALRNVRRVAKHGSTIFIVSDFRSLNEQAIIHMRQLSHHNDIVGVLIYDPLEKTLPPPDIYTITDGENKARINTANRRYRKQYGKMWEDHLSRIRSEFARIRSPLLELSTADPLVQSLASGLAEQAAQ